MCTVEMPSSLARRKSRSVMMRLVRVISLMLGAVQADCVAGAGAGADTAGEAATGAAVEAAGAARVSPDRMTCSSWLAGHTVTPDCCKSVSCARRA